MSCTPHPIPARATLAALSIALLMSACGGSGDDAPLASTPTPPPPPAASTTVTGAVVKGPVAGAQVCAYTVVANGRGAALGSCTTSDASGHYSFAVPAGTGPLWVEATGGSYTDEVTGAATTLPAGSPLRSLITANAGTVTTMLTPLTTLALNAATVAVGAGGALDAAAFSAAATQLLGSFNLPATLDITGQVPAFGSAVNAYGGALTVISQMVTNGTTLATLLATADPQTLAAAYATAAAPPVLPPVSPPVTPPVTPPAGEGPPSASGSLAVVGATAVGAATTLTPQADGFEVAVKDTLTSYRFYRATASPLTRVEVTVGVAVGGAITVSYYDLAARTTFNTCNSNCGVTLSAPAGATHPVTLSFAQTPLSGGLTLNGSLTGDAPGALWSPAELPRSTFSALTVGGVGLDVATSSDDSLAVGTTTQRSITLRLSDGSVLSLVQQSGGEVQATRVVPPASASFCFSACGITLTSTDSGSRVTFNTTTLSGGVVVNGTVDIGKTSGTLTSSDLGSFTPGVGTIESLNGKRTLTFNVLGTAAQAGLSLVTVEVQGGRVIYGAATVGIATQVLNCFDNGAAIGVPACTGITVAADGRSVTFDNAVLYGGAVGAAKRNVTFNGTVVAKGP